LPTRWIEFAPGTYFREVAPGEVQWTKMENVRESMEAKSRMREAIKGRIARETEAKDCGLRFLGSMPWSYFQEMIEKCGHDLELQQLYLRDHPELLCIPANSAGLPGRRSYSSPLHNRRA